MRRWAALLTLSLALHLGAWQLARAWAEEPRPHLVKALSIQLVPTVHAEALPKTLQHAAAAGADHTAPMPAPNTQPTVAPAADSSTPAVPLDATLPMVTTTLADGFVLGVAPNIAVDGGGDSGSAGAGHGSGTQTNNGHAGSGSLSVGQHDCWGPIGAELKKRVSHLPQALRRRGISGHAVVRFALDLGGRATQIVIEEQSGSPLVAQAVQALFEAPFVSHCEGQGRFPVIFEVRRG